MCYTKSMDFTQFPDLSQLPDFIPAHQVSQYAPGLFNSDPNQVFQSLPDFIPTNQIGTYMGYIQMLQPKGAPQMATGSSAPVTAPGDKQDVVNKLSSAATQAFGSNEVQPLLSIVQKESGFNPSAANKTSSARGLFQFLASTAKNYGLPTDATQAPVESQINAGLKYIKDRYGTPSNALNFHNAHGWY